MRYVRRVTQAWFEKTARDLQWDQVLERIALHCHADAARERSLAQKPFPERVLAAERQCLVGEALKLDELSAQLPIRSVPPIDELSAALDRAGIGNKEQLRDLAKVLQQAAALGRHTHERTEHCPKLKEALWSDPQLNGLQERITRAIDDHGEIRDGASEGLRTARRQLSQIRERLKGSVGKLISKYSSSLSGQYFADRDGRVVLPVRTEAQSQVDGIVLGVSGSGGTLYVEPRELTELNNRLHVAQASVAQEEQKVLSELSGAAANQLPEILQAYDVCLEADCLGAAARWAAEVGAYPVEFASETKLELVQFRHPLLIAQQEEVVPNDIRLNAAQCLIISGPNAGGKTVALKCLGLAVCLANAGFPLPCDHRSSIGWFDQVLTDVGDDQSLSRSLSTFSAHVSNLGKFLQLATDKTLVLLDEIAGGTDPDEGASLAEAVLVGFVQRGASVATTTHYERLKQLGAEPDPSYCNASVGFDLDRMLPTFELALGIPGASSAFAVAERYGIPEDLVESARQLMPQEQLDQQQVLQQVEQERQRLRQLREEAESELRSQRRMNEQIAAEKKRAFEQEKARLQKEARALTDEVKASRQLLRKVQGELGHRQALTKRELRDAERAIGDAAGPITAGGRLSQVLDAQPADPAPDPEQLTPKLVVRVPHLEADAEILEAPSKGQVRVQVGMLKMSVPVSKIRLKKGPSKGQVSSSRKPVRAKVKPQPTRAAAVRTDVNVCDLRGVRVEAGLDQVELFLDRMLQVGEPAAFILHGHGTGAMKSAVREHLNDLTHVEHWEPAPKEDGGDAFTVCWLRD